MSHLRSVTLVFLVAVIATACGGSTATSTAAPSAATASSASTSAAATSSAAPATLAPAAPLSIAVISLTAGNAVVYIAQAEGFFQKAGVEVKITDNAGATNVLNLTVAGTVDLGMGGITAPLLVVPDGKQTTILYQYQGNGAGGFMLGRKDITDISQVKRVGAGTPGSSVFGYCNWYKQSLKASFECVPMADGPTRRAALLANQIEAELDVYPALQDLIDNGQGNILIDTRDAAVRKKYIGTDFGETAIWGLTANIAAKKESVTRFMKALGMAMDFIDKSSDQAVAQSLRKNQIFQSMTEDTLTKAEKAYRQFNYPNHGYITSEAWTFALQQYAGWGLGAAFDPKADAFSYAKRVDMSYYEAGIGKPKLP